MYLKKKVKMSKKTMTLSKYLKKLTLNLKNPNYLGKSKEKNRNNK